MDDSLAMPTPESATALTQARIAQQAQIQVQKMAQDSDAAIASELLKTLGVGAKLDISG